METLFKKYFWTLQVAFVIALGLLLAGTANALLGVAAAPFSVAVPEAEAAAVVDDLDEPEPVTLNTDALGNPDPPAEPVADPCEDVECGDEEQCNPATGACEPVEPEVAPGPSDGRCVESDIAINLVGTMVADDPDWSMAVLHNPSTSKTQFAMIGTQLLAEAEVTAIERSRIFLLRNGREECLRPGDQAERQARAQAAGAASRPAAAPARDTPRRQTVVGTRTPTRAEPEPSTGGSIEDRVRQGVTRGENGEYNIDRGLIEEVANNRSLLEQQAPRVVPNYVNGQPRGFRLQGLRAGSIFSAIGIRNGDVLVSVNGTDIDSPQRAIQLYEAMLSQGNVEMQVLRRGREQTLRYNIQ